MPEERSEICLYPFERCQRTNRSFVMTRRLQTVELDCAGQAPIPAGSPNNVESRHVTGTAVRAVQPDL